jgi:hypothetical protein
MSLEDRGAQHDKEVVDKYHAPNVSYQMATYDYVMRPSANGISGPIVIVLPPVAEAKGRFYSIIARQADAVNTITISDDNDSECWVADIVLNAKCDRALLYSDGLAWQPMGSGPGRWPGSAATAAPGTTHAPTTLMSRTDAPETTVPQSTEAPSTEVPTT